MILNCTFDLSKKCTRKSCSHKLYCHKFGQIEGLKIMVKAIIALCCFLFLIPSSEMPRRLLYIFLISNITSPIRQVKAFSLRKRKGGCRIVDLTSTFIFFKGAQAWDIRDRVIYTERSHLGWWLEEWTKKSICVNCWVDIPHFSFLAMTEYAVKIIPCLLSMR